MSVKLDVLIIFMVKKEICLLLPSLFCYLCTFIELNLLFSCLNLFKNQFLSFGLLIVLMTLINHRLLDSALMD